MIHTKNSKNLQEKNKSIEINSEEAQTGLKYTALNILKRAKGNHGQRTKGNPENYV